MPAGIKPPPTFCGKKGRSGRYSVADEALKNRVKHRAWKMKEEKMSDNEAIQIVTKDMTVKTEHSGQVIIMNYDPTFNPSSEAETSNSQPSQI